MKQGVYVTEHLACTRRTGVIPLEMDVAGQGDSGGFFGMLEVVAQLGVELREVIEEYSRFAVAKVMRYSDRELFGKQQAAVGG